MADTLSRWAYPASKALADISKHGNRESTEEVREILKEEAQELARSTFVVGNGSLNRPKGKIPGFTSHDKEEWY